MKSNFNIGTLTLSAILALSLIGCGSSTDTSTDTTTAVDVTVLDGYIKDANVTDSTGQIATMKDATKGLYTFASTPTYPLSASGGQLSDTNLTFDINMSTDSGLIISPVSTIVKDNPTFLSYLAAVNGGGDVEENYIETDNADLARLAQICYVMLKDSTLRDKFKTDTNASTIDELIDNAEVYVNLSSDKELMTSYLEGIRDFSGSAQDIETALVTTKSNLVYGKNIISSATLTQSTTLNNDNAYSATQAIDGVDSTYSSTGDYNSSTGTWFQAAFTNYAKIQSVRILNIQDFADKTEEEMAGFRAKLAGAKVYVSSVARDSADFNISNAIEIGTLTSIKEVQTFILPKNTIGKYIIVEHTTDGLTLAEIKIGGEVYTDFAQGKSATQSSTYSDGSSYPATYAIDNNSTTFTAQEFDDLGVNGLVYWQLSLAGQANIERVMVLNRQDTAQERLDGVSICISDKAITDSSFTLDECSYDANLTASPMLQTYTMNTTGKYLILSKPASTATKGFSLASVAVTANMLPITREELDTLIANYDNAGQVDRTQYAYEIQNANVSEITNMESLFEDTITFNVDISTWDTSNVTNMSSMFSNAFYFNINISNWDTSKVTNMSSMFTSTEKFNQDISDWNTSKVKNMSYMFSNTRKFNQDISSWDTSSVKNMQSMFANAYRFNQDISAWDTSSVTNMYSMFSYAKVFDQNISTWNVSNVTNYARFDKSSLIQGTTKVPNFQVP